MNIKIMVISDTILLGVTIALGIILALSGKQYGIAAFSVHKVTALGAAIITFILCYRLAKASSLSGLFLVAAAVAAVSFIALFATGALMSVGHGGYRGLKAVHILSTILLTTCEIGIIIRFFDKFR